MAKKIYRILAATLVLLSAYIPFSDSDRRALGPVCLLFLLIPPIVERLFRMRLGYPVKCFTLLFCMIAFHLGVVLRWYDRYPGFDDFAHGLSGILFTVIGLCLYHKLTSFRSHFDNPLLQITYAFFFSMFVAVVWEIGEFLGFVLVGHDSQHHLDTGVFDTMEDIIACTLGSLLTALAFLIYTLKKKSPIMRLVQSFNRANNAER